MEARTETPAEYAVSKRSAGLWPLAVTWPEEEERVAEDATIKRALDILLARVMTGGPVMDSPQAVRDWLRLRLGGEEREAFGVMWLDAAHRLIRAGELFHGSLTQTTVYPREVVKEALRANAAAVILYHNHPSGNTEPSDADQRLTKALKNALELVDVRVLDHFVVGARRVESFAERGLL